MLKPIVILRLFVLIIASTTGAMAQPLPANALNAGSGINVTDHMLILDSKRSLGLYDASIEGSPYIDDNFTPAHIRSTRGVFNNVPARYNALDDFIEYQEKGITFAVTPSLNVKLVQFEHYRLTVDKLPSKGKGLTFFILLDSGRATLLSRRPIVLREAQAPKALEASGKPARFVQQPEEFYIKIGDELPTPCPNVKRLVDYLPDHREEIKQFLSKNKISKNAADLTRLVKYYNSL